MTQPKVSVIVPVYNAEKYLERCINSLVNQSLEDIEIILTDDASTDSSPQICDEFALKDPRIKVIHKFNEGAGMARNAALKIATGEYIAFADSDDFVDYDMLRIMYDTAQKYDSDLVMSGVVFVDGNMFSQQGDCTSKLYFDSDTHFETPDELKKLAMGIVGALPDDEDDSKYGMSIWKNLFRHQIIKDNGLKFQSEREFLSEDALFMIDYISCISKATGIAHAFYNYCRNEDSISKSYKKDRFEKSLIFVGEVEKRFQKDIPPQEYQIYIDRFWQALCRVLCSQEIMHAADNNIKYAHLKARLKAVCTHPLTVRVMNTYPIGKLPLKQRLFAYGIKHRLYYLLKVLVGLRR